MKERILTAASHLIEQYGLKKFTLDEISRTLGISKKTIYVFFPGKDAIISAYFDSVIESDRLHTLTQLEKAATLDEKLEAIIFSYHDYKLPLIVIEEARRSYEEEWLKVEHYRLFKVDLTRKILEQARDEGMIRETIDFRMVIYMIEKVSFIVYDHLFLTRNNLTLKQALNESIDIILNGLKELNR